MFFFAIYHSFIQFLYEKYRFSFEIRMNINTMPMAALVIGHNAAA